MSNLRKLEFYRNWLNKPLDVTQRPHVIFARKLIAAIDSSTALGATSDSELSTIRNEDVETAFRDVIKNYRNSADNEYLQNILCTVTALVICTDPNVEKTGSLAFFNELSRLTKPQSLELPGYEIFCRLPIFDTAYTQIKTSPRSGVSLAEDMAKAVFAFETISPKTIMTEALNLIYTELDEHSGAADVIGLGRLASITTSNPQKKLPNGSLLRTYLTGNESLDQEQLLTDIYVHSEERRSYGLRRAVPAALAQG